MRVARDIPKRCRVWFVVWRMLLLYALFSYRVVCRSFAQDRGSPINLKPPKHARHGGFQNVEHVETTFKRPRTSSLEHPTSVMIAFRWILLLFSLTAVEPFHAVPVPLSSRSIASRSPLPKVPLAAKGGADSARNMESEGPILLPPADYSKPGHVVNLVGVVGGPCARLSASAAFVNHFYCLFSGIGC